MRFRLRFYNVISITLHNMQGWIWNVCKADTDMFYSCAWDRYVKQWRIVDGHVNVRV